MRYRVTKELEGKSAMHPYYSLLPGDDGDFPYALVKAVEKAGEILLHSVARDVSPPKSD